MRFGRDVDLDDVFDESGLLYLETIDLDWGKVAAVSGHGRVIHRLFEVSDGG